MKKFFRANYFAIIMLFIYTPIIVMIIFSFNSGATVFSWQGFSFKWYKELFNNSPFIKSIITSLFVAVVSTLISLFIGVSAAIGLSKSKKITQTKWLSIANIPLINADVITAVSLMLVFLMSGIKFGIFTLIMAHVSFNVPYVLMIVMPRLRKLDKALIEVGSDLGASSTQLLFRVILPVLKPAIITATAIAFAMSFDDFIISYFTGGSQTNVASFIYTAKKIRPYIFAFGTIFVFILIIGILSWNAFSIYKQQKLNKIFKIKNNLYKVKELSNINKKIEVLENKLKTGIVVYHSKKLNLWFQYWILKIKLKIVSNKNYDKKISKYEWKRQKISAQIRKEKRYLSSSITVKKRIAKCKEQLKLTSDVSKAAKLTLQIERLEYKLENIQDEIEWVKNRDVVSAKKIKKIENEIQLLNNQLNELEFPSKRNLRIINNRIKKLEEIKIELEEGKNNYKLRLIVERLRELQDLNYNDILTLSDKKNNLEKQLFIEKQFTYKFDHLISIANTEENKQNLLNQKNLFIQRTEELLINKINHKNSQIANLQAKIQLENRKLSPNYDSNNNRSRNFLSRSWKTIVVILLWFTAFSGLTVAYVLNNTYDLVIGNWGQYIDPILLKEFENKYSVKVNYQEYDSNETLYNKLYTFNYDLMVPSDYMVQKLAQENRLELLDYSKLNVNKTWTLSKMNFENQEDVKKIILDENLVNLLDNYRFNVDSEERTLLDYSLPYFWGDIVIVVNPTLENQEFLKSNNINFNLNTGLIDQTELSWDILWKAKANNKRIVLNDDPKNIFMIANQLKKQSVNLTSKKEINEAGVEVKHLLKGKNVSLNNDEITTTVGQGMFDFAMMYNGDAIEGNLMWQEENNNHNRKLLFGRPNIKKDSRYQTTNIFSDNIVLSKNANNKELAYTFINFMIENMKKNGEYVGVPISDKEAMKELTTGDNKFADFRRLYYPAISVIDSSSEYKVNGNELLSYTYNPGIDEYLVEQFNEIMASRSI